MGIGQPLEVGEGYYSVGIVGMRSDVALCAAGSYCPGDGLSYLCPVGTFGDMDGQTNSTCSGDCLDGVVCEAGSTSSLGRPCPVGQYCVTGVAYPCPSGTYNSRVGAANSSECTPCPPGRFNNKTGAWDAAMCLLCSPLEGSDVGASACWPGLLGAFVEDPEPVVPGLSRGDVLTLYFTKQTNSPDVSSTAAILNLFAFEPWLATSIQGLVCCFPFLFWVVSLVDLRCLTQWMIGGDELYPQAAQRLALVLSGTLNLNKSATAMGVAGVRMLATGGLQDDRGVSQAAHTEVLTVLHGTWGDSSQPQLMSDGGVIALPYGANEGLDAGDGLLFRFNQPVKQVPVHDKSAIDALLTVTPSTWALDYQGIWVDETSLFVQVLQYVFLWSTHMFVFSSR